MTGASISLPQALGEQSFLSEDDCRLIARHLSNVAHGGGLTTAVIWSHWSGHVTWGRNQIVAVGDVRNDYIKVNRSVQGARCGLVLINQADDQALVAAARRAERLNALEPGHAEWELLPQRYTPEEATQPRLFSKETYQLDAEHRSRTVVKLAAAASDAGMLSAGFIETSANCVAIVDSLNHVRYAPYTQASCSLTVRDPSGSGSGWSGVDWFAWSRIDMAQLAEVALHKCLSSRNPVAVEPGRYTTILEPQAVSDFVGPMFRDYPPALNKEANEWERGTSTRPPFSGEPRRDLSQGVIGMSRIGQKVVDERISVWADPMDSDLGFAPFTPDVWNGFLQEDADVYHPATWIKDGVLVNLAYDRSYAIKWLGRDTGLPNQGAFRMSGGTTPVEEMISTTKRGVLVTRFSDVMLADVPSVSYRGYTRDGLWLIEDGKISKPIRNFMFRESVLHVLNSIEQLGVPERTFHPALGRLQLPQPAVVPPLKVKGFSFVALTDAV